MDISEEKKIERHIVLQLGSVKKILGKKHGLLLPGHCDNFIARCIRVKDGDIEKATKLILTYRNGITQIKDWGVALIPSVYESFYKDAVLFLRHSDSFGRRVVVVRSKFWDPQEFSFESIQIALWLVCEHLNGEYEEIQRLGYVVVWDFTQFSWQQAWAVNHWKMLIALKWAQNGVGGKIHAVNVIFHPKAVRILYAGIRPFMTDKLRKRITFHDNLESLHSHVSTQILPDYLGGTLSLEDCIDETALDGLLEKDKYFEEIMRNGIPSK